MYIVICDDEIAVCHEIKGIIEKKYGQAKIDEVNNLKEYCESLEKHSVEVPDIIIMDVQWENAAEDDAYGISTAAFLQKEYPKIKIIFLTGFIHYATDIFEAKPSAFLTKPVEVQKLLDTIEKVIRDIVSEDNETLLFQNAKAVMQIKTAEILYLESNRHELIFHMRNEEKKRIWMKLDEVMKQLPNQFVRIHQSYAVNMSYLIKVGRTNVTLMDGTELPISRSRYHTAKEKFLDYLETK